MPCGLVTAVRACPDVAGREAMCREASRFMKVLAVRDAPDSLLRDRGTASTAAAGAADLKRELLDQETLDQQHPVRRADGDVVVVEVVAGVVDHARTGLVAVAVTDQQIASRHAFEHE